MARARPLTSLSALVLASALAVAACGGDDDDAATTTAAPATTAAATTSPASTQPATTAAETTAPATTAPETTAAPATTAAALGSVIDVATQAGDLGTLLSVIDAAGMTNTLATGKFTLLAPTDEAFAALGQTAVDGLLADPAAATAMVNNLVLPVPQNLHTIGLFGNVVTIGGGSLPVTNDGTTVTVGGAAIVTADLQADHGIIQVTDAVPMPSA
jgi:uncharacterized surface protein with fasciclin (FAS1) repeats